MDRDRLRKDMLEKRNAMDPGKRAEDSRRIFARLKELPVYEDASSVFFYHSFGSEVETQSMIEQALRKGKAVALPKVKDSATMLFYYVEGLGECQSGAFGVPEPPEGSLPAFSEPDLVIVPGLVFDREGNRLGYGKGYYDRFFKTLPFGVPKAALAFDEQLVATVLKEEYDVSMDFIITPTEVITV